MPKIRLARTANVLENQLYRIAADTAPKRRTLGTKPARRPALGFLSAMAVGLAYLGSKGSYLYEDARSPLRKAHSALARRMFIEIWPNGPMLVR